MADRAIVLGIVVWLIGALVAFCAFVVIPDLAPPNKRLARRCRWSLFWPAMIVWAMSIALSATAWAMRYVFAALGCAVNWLAHFSLPPVMLKEKADV